MDTMATRKPFRHWKDPASLDLHRSVLDAESRCHRMTVEEAKAFSRKVISLIYVKSRGEST